MTHRLCKGIAAMALSLGFMGGAWISPAFAGPADFHNGSFIPEYGKIARVKTTMPIPKRAKFKILLDTAKAGEAGAENRTLGSAARFLNMHAEAGIPAKHMKLAVVFHGKGSFDLTQNGLYGAKYDGAENANAGLIKALTDKGVRVILCGQSAVYHGIENEDLLPGVEMALSAMTAHALLQQEGYTLNPF